MLSRKIIAHFLLFLQILTLTSPGLLVASTPVEDPEEIHALTLPTSGTFKAIQKQWVRLQPNASNAKVKKFDLSKEALEKIAKKKGSKKHNTQLLSTILDFFIATSPREQSAIKFLKPRDWEDLQLFNTKNNLLQSISGALSKSGDVYTAGLVTQRAPIAEIMLRRDFISALREREDIINKIEPLRQDFAEYELNLYSDTMQPENEVIKKSVESLAPGFLLSQVPGLAKNPGFLRFHALLTQKLAPWFWDPLTIQCGLGFSILSLMPNGIVQTIVKDFFAYIFSEMDKKSNRDPKNTFDTLKEKALGYIEDVKGDGSFVPAYVRNHLAPKGSRTKFFVSLLNDMFLWQTNELRVALHRRKNQGKDIPQPKNLVDGPHYSLWANNQYRHNIFLDPLTNLAKHRFDEGYHDQHKSNPNIKKIWDILTFFDEEIQKAFDPEKDLVDRTKHGANAFWDSLYKATSFAFNKFAGEDPVDPDAPVPAPVEPVNAAELERINRYIEDLKAKLERLQQENSDNQLTKLLNAIKKIATRLLIAEQQAEKFVFSEPKTKPFASNLVSYLENWKNSANAQEKVELTRVWVKFLLWIIVTVLVQMWVTNNGEQQQNIKMLDGIMFGSAKPGMNLIASVETIKDLLEEHAQGLSIPTTLQKKLDDFDALATSSCEEVVALSKSKTFSKRTGHRIFDHTGEVRRGYQLIQHQDTRKLLTIAIHIMAEIDCYMGICTLAKNCASGENQFCPVDFITAETPFISAKTAWFPLLGDKAIGSDFLMGDAHAPNILLTGINGGGKSITLKTVVLMLAMAHSFGWVAAQQCSMTPFAELNLHLNSLDNAADGKSRWVAEAEAIVSMINTAETVHSPNYFVYLSGDELGDGTAADASIKVMINLLLAITKQKRAISFIASHLQKLTELEGVMPRIFNYRINPNRKLEPGVNQTNIAMAIFEKFSNVKQKDHGLAATLANHATNSDVKMIG